MVFLPGVVTAVLETDNIPIRFENFCIDLLNKSEGLELVPTSRTRDMGRDGRSVLIRFKKGAPILCATTQGEIDYKVEHDISRLSETTVTDTIIYCSSKKLTEAKCDGIEAKIRQLYSGVSSVRVLGQVQIASLIERYEDVFKKHYPAEIQNVEEALMLRPATTPDIKDLGLRLALCTYAGDDASELRKELAKRLVLYTLNNEGPLNPAQVASIVTRLLHLPRALSANYVFQIFYQLSSDDLVTIGIGDVASVTDAGTQVFSTLPEESGIILLEGRIAIREAITKLCGYELADPQFDKLWNVFQDGITDIFYTHGLSIFRMIRSVLAGKTDEAQTKDINSLIEKLADRSVSHFSEPTQASEVRQAIIDMFSEKGSQAFQWLTQICCVYVMMCSLGFESISSKQIIEVLSGYHLVPDSDVVISLLCEGEENHEHVNKIILGWKAIGGKLFVTPPVLEEIAYHAWISEYDYSFYGPELYTLSDDAAMHVLDNAFVRAFKKNAGELTTPRYWNHYIQQFRGSSELDYHKILNHLKADYGFEIIDEHADDYASLEKDIEKFLINRISRYSNTKPDGLDYRVLGKLRRDARLLSCVYAEKQSRIAAGEISNTCIISSASLLKEADLVFRKLLGHPEIVLSTAAIGFLITLTLQVPMGFNTLRCVLFDSTLAVRLTPAQKHALRLIAASGQYDLPWSRRGTLRRELQDVLYEEAKSKGEPVAVISKRVIVGKDAEYSASMIAAALDRMAVTPKTIEAIAKLQNRYNKIQE